MPFLENVLRGKNVPPERLREVAEHYQHFGGVSPINAQCRALVAALREELERHGPPLPVYWGNRNWHPLLADTLRQMADDGVRRALAFVTSAYGSYSGCRQYLDDIARARAEVGERAPEVDKLPALLQPPRLHRAAGRERGGRLRPGPAGAPGGGPARLHRPQHPARAGRRPATTRPQLRETAALVAFPLGRPRVDASSTRAAAVRRASRGSSPTSSTTCARSPREGVRDVVVAPIGFLSDHMEVLYDLDLEAKSRALELGLNLVRAEHGRAPTRASCA